MPVTSPICQYAPTGCWHVGMGATSAEKFEGTSRGECQSPSISSVPSLSPVLDPPVFYQFPSLLFFPSLLKFSKEVWGSTVS